MMNQRHDSPRPGGAEDAARDGSAAGAPDVCRLFDLAHLGLIGIRGADADDFLQGQSTSDIRLATPTRSQLGSHCNQKGRMLAIFRLLRIGGSSYLQLPAERLPALLQRLRLFVLRSKVSLTDDSDALMRIGIAGPLAGQRLAERGLEVPVADDGQAATGELVVARHPGSQPRLEILGPPAAVAALAADLADATRPGSPADWSLFDIQAGIPTLYSATAELVIPQMANLDLIGGVSFDKGCYVGQEVVARMQHLGKTKRRMYLAEIACDEPPAPGTELWSPTSASQQATGWILDAAPLAAARCAALAVVETSAAEGGEVRLGEQGPMLSLTPPPYGLGAPG